MRAVPAPLDARARATMKANRRRDTGPELQVRRLLHRAGLRYRTDVRVDIVGVVARPDIVFTRARVAVFIDGCFWHGCPQHGKMPRHNRNYWAPKLRRNAERDRSVDAALQRAGWRVIRCWEHEDAVGTAARIAAVVRSRSS